MTDAFAEVKARLDLLDVAGDYTRLTRHGQEHRGLCPLHSERTPSFYVSPVRQLWYCYGCSDGGDVFTLVEKVERIDRREALERLAERAGVELERAGGERHTGRRRRVMELNARAAAWFEHVLWNTDAGATGRALLDDRGVTEEAARRFGIGWAPAGGRAGDALVRYLVARCGSNPAEAAEAGLAHPPGRGLGARDRFRDRLIFPIRDDRGAVLGFGGRATGDAVPKYLNTPDTVAYSKSRAIFGVDLARTAVAESSTVVVVEGYFDVVAAHTAEVHNVVASSGTALTAEQVRQLGRLAATFVLCFDGDPAGRAASARAAEVVAAEGFTARIVELPPEAKDPDELVRSDPAAFRRCVAEARPEWEVLLDRALQGDEVGSVEDRRRAEQRAAAMLARIPDAAARTLYVQRAARLLGLRPADVDEGVQRIRGGAPASRPSVRVTEEPPVAAEASPPEPPPPVWEELLGALVAKAPELARRFVDELGLQPGDIRHGGVRRLFESSLAAGDAPRPPLDTQDELLVARLSTLPVPQLEPSAEADALDGVMRDVARDVAEATVRERMQHVRHELRLARDEGRQEDAERLHAEFRRLADLAPRLRRSLARR